jgi:hypothetical protein
VLDALEVNLETGAETAPVARTPEAANDRAVREIEFPIQSLMDPHNDFGGVLWNLSRNGLTVDGKIDRDAGRAADGGARLDDFPNGARRRRKFLQSAHRADRRDDMHRKHRQSECGAK